MKTLTAGVSLAALLAVVARGDTIRESNIVTEVMGPDLGLYTYQYTVQNLSPPAMELILTAEGVGAAIVIPENDVWALITAYVLPLNSPGDVQNVQSPETWDYEILSALEYPNPFDSPYVLRWFDTDPPPVVTEAREFARTIAPDTFNSSLTALATGPQFEFEKDMFSFQSMIPPVDGPYLTEWLDLDPFIGDPPLPGEFNGSVSGGGLPYTRVGAAVPEPSEWAMFGAGLWLFVFFSTRRWSAA